MYLNEMAQLQYANGEYVKIDNAKIFINGGDHNPPHIHVKLPNKDIFIEIKTFKSKPENDREYNKIKKDVVDWIMRNQEELLECFEESQKMPNDNSIYQRKFNESIDVNDELYDIVPIVNVEFYDDENLIVDFNCGISMLYNINQIPSTELKNKLLKDKNFYYGACEYTNYGIYWDTDGVDAYRIWEDGEII